MFLNRYVVERFFAAVFEAIVANDSIISLVKEKSSEYSNLFDVKKNTTIATPKPYPKMSTINKILINEEIQLAIWNVLQIPNTIKMPKFSLSILYGRISEMIHFPDIGFVFISDRSDEEYKKFIKQIVVFSDNIKVEEFSEEEAAAGAEP